VILILAPQPLEPEGTCPLAIAMPLDIMLMWRKLK